MVKVEVGFTNTNRIGHKYEVIKYTNAKSVTVKFVTSGYTKVCEAKEVRSGGIKDLLSPTSYGVGFLGEGKYTTYNSITKKMRKSYNAWHGMLGRCYSKASQDYKYYGGKGVVVCKEWHNFQNYCVWYYENYKEGFQSDKDILEQGCSVYSPTTCVMIPQQLNKMLTFSNKARGDLPLGVTKVIGCHTYGMSYSDHLKGDIYEGGFPDEYLAHERYLIVRKESIVSAAEYYYNRGDINDNTKQALYEFNVELVDT